MEIECQSSDDDLRDCAHDQMPQGVQWGSDRSISHDGVEIRTPIMSGDKGEAVVNAICHELKENQFEVDKSCGYHLHVECIDAKDNMSSKCRNLWLFYIAFEDVIMSFLPKSRRNNKYCQTLRSDYHFKEVRDAGNIEELEKIWYRVKDKMTLNRNKREKKNGTRYRGINMHTLFAFKHVEIRFHSGTINARKILEWVALHTAIVDRSFNVGFDHSELKRIHDLTDITDKTEEMFHLISVPLKTKDYFLTRQEVFAPPRKLSSDKKVEEETKEALSEEVEA